MIVKIYNHLNIIFKKGGILMFIVNERKATDTSRNAYPRGICVSGCDN